MNLVGEEGVQHVGLEPFVCVLFQNVWLSMDSESVYGSSHRLDRRDPWTIFCIKPFRNRIPDVAARASGV